jgi:hypothetical protein
MWEGMMIGALAVGGMIWAHQESKLILGRWRAAVESSGLRIDMISSPWSWNFRLKASAGPVQVRIGTTRQKRGGGIRVVFSFPETSGLSEVRIRREVAGALRKPREIEVGDPAFDETFLIQGPIRPVSALLDAETRRLLRDIHDGCRGVEIGGGTIVAEMMPSQLSLLLPLLLDVADRFAEPGEIRLRLADNAQRDPEAGVRLHNLLLLARELPDSPDTLAALRLACADESPEVRLRAAMELGAEGREVLLELAESQVDDAVSAQAVTSLGRELPFERAHLLLLQALRRRRVQTARACLDVLAISGAATAVEVLASVLARENSELAAAAALALGTTENPAAEPALIRALRREDKDVQVTAAKALGRVGTAAAVLPLKEVAEHRDPDLRRATRQAVAEIQSRLPGATPGQLSLAGSEAGQLSLAQAEQGQLSLATEAGGQLSLPPEPAGRQDQEDREAAARSGLAANGIRPLREGR